MNLPARTRPRFSVVTPVYNRKAVLHRPFESLQAQTMRDFEWILIDDGSTDNLRPLLEQFRAEADFPVVLIFQVNAGKHAAWNNAMRSARGELCVQLDSDDVCVPQTLETFASVWDGIPAEQRSRFSGVNVLCYDPATGNTIGTPYPTGPQGGPLDTNNLDLEYKHHVSGEHWGCVRCDLLREFPFPETDVSTYVPECVVWYRLARNYKVRCVNVALRGYFNDQANSITKRSAGKRRLYGDWISNTVMLVDYLDYVARDLPLLVRTAANTWRYARHASIPFWRWCQSLRLRLLIALPLMPLGEWLYRRDIAEANHPAAAAKVNA